MPNEPDVTQKIRIAEKLKCEILSSVSDLYSEIFSQSDADERAQTLADIIIFTYMLGNIFGVSNSSIDSKAVSKLRLNIVEENILYSQSMNLLKHIMRTGGSDAQSD